MGAAWAPALGADRGRHIAVLAAAARGSVNRDIARKLGYSPRTVEGLVEEARTWLGARNRPHAVARAVGAGLVPLRDAARLAWLSPRQRELAEAVARGLTTTAAARTLGISAHTASAHLRSARRVTGCRTSAALAALVASAACAQPARPSAATAGALLALLEAGRIEDAKQLLRAVAARSGADS